MRLGRREHGLCNCKKPPKDSHYSFVSMHFIVGTSSVVGTFTMCGTSLFKVLEPKIATLSSYEFFWLHAMQGVFLSNLVFIRLMTCVNFDTLDQRVYWLNQYIADSLCSPGWLALAGFTYC